MQPYTSIPFKSDSGLSQVNGVAKFSSAGVVLEYESKLFGLISTGVKESRLAPGDIHDIKFKKGLLKRGTKIEIRVRSLVKLKEMPNSEGKVTLKIEADDYESARDAVVALQKEMLETAAATPPTHSPLSDLFNESEDDAQEAN